MRALILALSLLALPAAAVEITGKARVVDGDTIDVEGIRVRLHGIDAPEVGQMCKRATGKEWDCGTAARDRLATLADHKVVTCESSEWDAYKRLVATCYIEGEPVQEPLVREGLAFAFTRYSRAYVALESEARGAHRGVWDGDNEAPWNYRARQWQTGTIAQKEAPKGCVIKGNVNMKGDKIYHMPWSPWYQKITMNPQALAHGKRWFCDENEARQAGFRPANWSR